MKYICCMFVLTMAYGCAPSLYVADSERVGGVVQDNENKNKDRCFAKIYEGYDGYVSLESEDCKITVSDGAVVEAP